MKNPISTLLSRFSRQSLVVPLAFAAILGSSLPALAQACYTGADLDAATKSSVEAAARRYFDMSAQGDVSGLKSNSIPPVAANFAGIEQAVVSNKQYFAQGQPTITGTYVLDASQAKGTLERGEFYCGIYNSPDRVGFAIPNLPAGKYAVVIEKVTGTKDPITLTMVLQDVGGGSWKLAGYYPRLNSLAGHDAQWYLDQARQYKTQGQTHNAWFYYLTAWDLMAPVNFMGTPKLDRLGEEVQNARPVDLPSQDKPLALAAGTKTYNITDMSAVAVGTDLDLRVRYQTPDATNTAQAFQDNIAVIKAIVAKYPELRNAFAGVVARAVDTAGRDYGTLLPMKEIK